MPRRDFLWFLFILLLTGAAGWMALNPDYPVQPGLDLQGGLQVLLEADVPPDRPVEREQMDTSRQIISQRVNALGVAEPLIQLEGERRILVELPGIDNPDQAIELIQGTALLEFVDTGDQSLPPGMCVRTSLNDGPSPCELQAGGTESTPPPTYETILTGTALENATVQQGGLGESYQVVFDLQPEAAGIFEEFTRSHRGQFLTIVLDKQVISSPQIEAVISDVGTITGAFTLEEAQQLALQLRYGSLPIPLKISSTRQIGATLGAASIEASVQAGVIGVSIVLLFMLIYYRLPGVLADVALLIYALLNFALFKWLSVTLTLPAITGFLLSTGMAVDANILVFERIKEEIREGGLLEEAIDVGFNRAWTSIRDSNVATLVICFILWTFGRNFGASIVQGFALTLAIGVMISMFTAVTVTRTFVRLVIGRAAGWLQERKWLLAV
ncbi:MAG: protein translocase subunit SecD [Chloroflexi bacterium]|nr:protein translocase subunit SecD [Chloroflexota bacterium]MCI0648951.1 protein translocase subunit SecD [Chloroflexota bacterium]MCI0725822.1 protein translocase subunit SecD [Chloroflexota bacterium]